jgi:hypothetical protein
LLFVASEGLPLHGLGDGQEKINGFFQSLTPNFAIPQAI